MWPKVIWHLRSYFGYAQPEVAKNARLGRIWRNFRLRMRIIYFRTVSLPVTWLPVMSLPVAPHCPPSNNNLSVPIYYSCHSSPPLKIAWIFSLVALLNFTTTCQCHFWSTISVDGSTSQIACTWMIQMTLNGVSQKQKIGHLMGHYMTPHYVSQVIEARNVG
jgi:hypothetical protein